MHQSNYPPPPNYSNTAGYSPSRGVYPQAQAPDQYNQPVQAAIYSHPPSLQYNQPLQGATYPQAPSPDQYNQSAQGAAYPPAPPPQYNHSQYSEFDFTVHLAMYIPFLKVLW